MRVTLTLKSGNRKTGPIPVSMTEAASCPDRCAWKGNGCYAAGHWLGRSWQSVPRRGLPWEEFCRAIARLPKGQLWRHNQAGDLPGQGDSLDVPKLATLVAANHGKRGFTYTHKPWSKALDECNRAGFAVNLSCDSLAEVDAHRAAGHESPLVVVVPRSAPDRFRSPGGAHVVVCPAQTKAGRTCTTCGLCAVTNRKAVIASRKPSTYR